MSRVTTPPIPPPPPTLAPPSASIPLIQTPVFTSAQTFQLKAQIYAFRHHIAKGILIPPILNNAVKGLNPEFNVKEYERQFMPKKSTTGHPISGTTPPHNQPQQPQQQQQPQSQQQQQQHQQQQARVAASPSQATTASSTVASASTTTTTTTAAPTNVTNEARLNPGYNRMPFNQFSADGKPISMPVAIDPVTLFMEREKRLLHKMKQRELELKSYHLGASHQREDTMRALVELKVLGLVSLQKKVRSEVVGELQPSQQALNKQVMKRVTKSAERDRKAVKEQHKLMLETEVRRKERHHKFLNDLVAHRKKMNEYFKENRKRNERLFKDMAQYFEQKEKQAKAAREKAERDRLRALKENDIASYLKLLENTKESRLIELLRQTDECLNALGAQLVITQNEAEQRQETAPPAAGSTESEPSGEASASSAASTSTAPPADGQPSARFGEKPESVYAKYLRNQQAYYTVAHKMEEVIDKQPSMLKGGDLKPYQLKGLQWMVSLYNNKLNGILADEMGLGKTIQTISLLAYLMEMKDNKGPHLVIVPLSTIQNWIAEFQKWAPGIKVVKYGGDQRARKQISLVEIKERKFNVLLTQYEFVSRDRSVLRKVAWDYIIIDEGHRIKNAHCKLVQDLNTYKSKHRLLLTGTPLQNDLKELWALMNYLLPSVFDHVENFETWFNAPFANTQDKAELTEEERLLIVRRLHQVLRPFLIRREKHEVEHQLPEKVEKVIRCSLSSAQKAMYRQIQNDGKLLLSKNTQGGGIKSKALNNTMMQLRKVCNHPFLFQHDWSSFGRWKEDIFRCSGKFELLDRMLPKLKATGHRVLIFSQMTQLLNLLEDYLEFRQFKYSRLDGSVQAAKRGELVTNFAQDESVFCFLLSTRAGGLGLNLQSADTVIMFDSDWNPQQDLQAQARVHRIGQTKAVRVFTLLSTTPVEEKIRDRALSKKDAEAMIIHAGLFNQKSTDRDRENLLTELIRMEADSKEVNEVPTEDQLNVMMARSEAELETFQQMDAERQQSETDLWVQQRGLAAVPSRLMTEEELPEWMRESSKIQAQMEAEKTVSYGRGRRMRKEVSYVDDLTDNQFFSAVEEGVDLNEVRSKSRQRAAKRKRHDDEDGRVEDSDTTTTTNNDADEESVASPVASEDEEEEQEDGNPPDIRSPADGRQSDSDHNKEEDDIAMADVSQSDEPEEQPDENGDESEPTTKRRRVSKTKRRKTSRTRKSS